MLFRSTRERPIKCCKPKPCTGLFLLLKAPWNLEEEEEVLSRPTRPHRALEEEVLSRPTRPHRAQEEEAPGRPRVHVRVGPVPK